jgi:hypothetical protein
MTRRLLNLLTALSLLLCVAAVSLWVRSYYVSDSIAYYCDTVVSDGSVGSEWSIETKRGTVFFARRWSHSVIKTQPTVETTGSVSEWSWNTGPSFSASFPHERTAANRMGFFWGVDRWNGKHGDRMRGETAICPWWATLTALATLSGLVPSLRARRRVRRLTLGHCPSCGYGLTGNVSGVCPECGGAR